MVDHSKNSCCIENCNREGDHALIVKMGESKILVQVCNLCKKLIENEEEFIFSIIPLKNNSKRISIKKMHRFY